MSPERRRRGRLFYSGPLRRRTVREDRRKYRREHSAIALLGLLCLGAGVQFFTDPSSLGSSSVGQALDGPLDEVWSLLYIFGGAGLLYGCLRPDPRVELPSHTLIFTALIVNGVAIVGVRGIGAFTTLPAVGFACWVVWVRIAELRAIAREARDAKAPPPALLAITPALLAPLLVEGTSSLDLGPLIVALLGGGIITALAQAFLFRSNRDDLVSRASRQAVGAVGDALALVERRADELAEELEAERRHRRELANELDTERELVRRLRVEVGNCHDEIAELRARLDAAA